MPARTTPKAAAKAATKAPRVSPSRPAGSKSDAPTDKQIRKALQEMPNIGPRMADDLVRLGIRRIEDLRHRDPMEMYDAISALDGVRHDPCVLDTYMAAVDYAKTGKAVPWWEYTPKRKALLKAQSKKSAKHDPKDSLFSGKTKPTGAKRR